MAFKSQVIKLDARAVPAPHPDSKKIKATAGKVWVEMLPPREEMGGFALPDVVGQKYRANVGAVLSAGGPRYTRHESKEIAELKAASRWLQWGDAVLTRPYDGEWFEETIYPNKSRVVCYGLHATPPLEDVVAISQGKTPQSKEEGETWVIDWWESVVAKIVGTSIIPLGDNVLIRRKKREYALVVPVNEEYEEEAEIIAVGWSDIQLGPAVCKYAYEDLLEIEFHDESDLAIVPASTVKAYVTA